ncbi:hypothetical protein FHETE_11248 [Fusarium heterosporum]|uniref:Uncharacterized protein n=1 Tax=Fusarium heterosporum TaxID=42747 RepID=A0A8H5SQD3_FUSHE|nr:hypothetical protein FHETE_11248 [Fusarium heterosporum]
MAHQEDRLPWRALASVFELNETNSCQRQAYNIHIRDGQDTRETLTQFLDAFIKNATVDASRERKRYQEKYHVPDTDEVIITDEMARKITPTVQRWNPDKPVLYNRDDKSTRIPRQGGLCPHKDEFEPCFCALPYKERKMAAFERKYEPNDCYQFHKHNAMSFRNLEITKSLLLHGEMEPILRSCSNGDGLLKSWWELSQCQCLPPTVGWDMMYKLSLKMYMTLNILYCFPETWDKDGIPIDDYRNLKSYQKAVRSATKSGCISEIAAYPHRDLFGIEQGQFNAYPRPFYIPRWKDSFMKEGTFSFFDDLDLESSSNNEDAENTEKKYDLEYYPYGLMSYQDFLDFEKPVGYQPHSTDIPAVRQILCHKGLPTELADAIMAAGSYTPARGLLIAGEPFHPTNRAELDQYLENCWQIIIRCIMVGMEMGEAMPMKMFARSFKASLSEIFLCECEFTFHLFRHFDEKPGEEDYF